MSDINIPEGVVYLSEHCFTNCVSLTYLVLPQSLRSLDRGVFEYCTGLTTMTIPRGVEQVGALLFSECSHLTSVDWHPQAIPEGTFKNCTSLAEYAVPEGVTHIYANAFDGCSRLSRLSLPASLSTIDPGAFKDCTSLKEVVCGGATPPHLPFPTTTDADASLVFEGVNLSRAMLSVSASALSAYQQSYPWCLFGHINPL